MSIHLHQLTKWFGDTLVLNGVSLEIQDAELLVLIGGSGSGKSTLLRVIAGLIRPDAGRVVLQGRDVTDVPPQARGTGFVFQNYSIFRHMSVLENIEFGLRIRRVPEAERRLKAEALLDLVGLVGLHARYASELSGGQQQRVALARALAYNPSVLLLDEPFAALDVKIRAQLRQSLKQIQRQLGVTAVLVTHDQLEAFELADRIGVIDRGELVEVGTPDQLYHHPQQEFTATFLGGGNVLGGRYDDGLIRLGGTTLPMPAAAEPHDDGAPVRVLFRPESVLLQEHGFHPGAGVPVLGRGRVRERIFSGASYRVVLSLDALTGARPLTPEAAYGQQRIRIEALLPGNGPAPAADSQYWVGLSDYHVLSPTGLKLLILVEAVPEGSREVAFGLELARRAGGPFTLLAVGPSPTEAAELRALLAAEARAWDGPSALITERVRSGHLADELLRETLEGQHELVVISSATALAGEPALWRRLVDVDIPVLVVGDSAPQLNRILVCTAAGEPGKNDVRFAGRLARRAGADVTVFHVLQPGAPPPVRDRAGRHLDQAAASLRALEVSTATRLTQAEILPELQREIQQGGHDLVVLGAPISTLEVPAAGGLTETLLKETRSPILVVPLQD